MNFIEAKKILSSFKGGATRSFLLGLSGTGEPFIPYIRAWAAMRNIEAQPLPTTFGTLRQHLLAPSSGPEAFLLLPWDFFEEADWRSGIPRRTDLKKSFERAEAIVLRLLERGAQGVYIDAPIPPLHTDRGAVTDLASYAHALAARVGLRILPSSCFSLASYFSSGCPVGGAELSAIAQTIVDIVLERPNGQAKVLVSDLDQVMWAGIVGEDGPEVVDFKPEGKGFKHFVYQSFLARLHEDGALLAAVSRNDLDLAAAPFGRSDCLLKESDLVSLRAGYGAKSAHIAALAKDLNLGLDSFVFVDDNPVELAEVTATLPEVTCVGFPERDDALPAFLDHLADLFHRREVTQEDRQRTELYRRRMAGQPPAETSGVDLMSFLVGLGMELTINDRTNGSSARAVQLINKTNQFNLNGRRFQDDEIDIILKNGGRLITASLADRAGSHGEILSCLLDATGRIQAFVMSCRVLTRRVEYAFVCHLAAQFGNLVFAFEKTDRNTPLRLFFQEAGLGLPAGEIGDILLDAPVFIARHSDSKNLFSIREEGFDRG